MRAFIDTNIIIDVLARREPFYSESRRVLQWCQSGCGCGLVSTLTYANVAYVMRKHAGFEPMRLSINSLHKICETASMSDSTVKYAIESSNSDFEDAMQYESALSARADIIVTRDIFYPPPHSKQISRVGRVGDITDDLRVAAGPMRRLRFFHNLVAHGKQ